MNIYVGNLSFGVTEDDLRAAFQEILSNVVYGPELSISR